MPQIQLPEATPLSTVARQHAQSEPSLMLPDAAAGRTMPSAEAMTAPRAREQCRPPLRGLTACRPLGAAHLALSLPPAGQRVSRACVRCGAASSVPSGRWPPRRCSRSSGALALPADRPEAQTCNVLVSNIGQAAASPAVRRSSPGWRHLPLGTDMDGYNLSSIELDSQRRCDSRDRQSPLDHDGWEPGHEGVRPEQSENPHRRRSFLWTNSVRSSGRRHPYSRYNVLRGDPIRK